MYDHCELCLRAYRLQVPFGENGKETYMVAMNPFLQANKNYATDIYKKVMVRT